MPAASTTSAQDINNEIGYTSTQSVNLNETRVRNLANDQSGEISFAQCRWGINFRGGEFFNGLPYARRYASDAKMIGYAEEIVGAPASASASSSLILRSNGQMTVVCTVGGVPTQFNNTWLTSGSAGDYTAQITVSSGSWTSGTTGSDLALSTTRTWEISATRVTTGITSNQVSGNLIIKDSGGTLITRPYDFTAVAESSL